MKKVKFYFIFIFLSLIFQSIAIIFGKYASLKIVKFNIYNIITNKYYILSLLFFGLQAITWQLTLRKFPLFFAYLFMSLIYIIILLASYYLFKEQISLFNILGSIIIVFGVIIITFKKEEN